MLKLNRTLHGTEHLTFHVLQLIGDVALTVGDGLFAVIFRRYLVQVGAGHLNKVAEHIVEAHLQGGDARALNLTLLQLGYPLFALPRTTAQFIKLCVKPITDKSAFLQNGRRLFNNGPVNQVD